MKFLKQCLAIVLLYPVLMLTACNQQAVVTDIQRFLPAVTNVAEAICAFSPTAPICQTAVGAVTASAKVLLTALSNYYAAKAAGTMPPSVWADLQLAITTFESDAANILSAVHVVDPAHQKEIEALAAAAQVLLAVIETVLPSGAVVTAKFAAHAPSTPFNLSKWVADYNAKVDEAQKKMPRNVSLKKVHSHNVFMRVATLGVAK